MSAAVRVKICGLVRPEDLRAAVDLGVEYVGVVLAPGSPRSLTPDAAARLLRACDTRRAARVGVFQDQPARFVNDVVERCRLDYVQLHGHEPRDFPLALRVPAIRVVRLPAVGDGAAAPEPDGAASAVGRRVPLAPNVFAVLVDAEGRDGASGGLGRRIDPGALAGGLAALPEAARVFLSGGLDPDNVAALARRHRPWAVDVSSGVERTPGVKDHDRLAAFVAAVRTRP